MRKFKAIFVPKGSRYGYSLIIEANTQSDAEKEAYRKAQGCHVESVREEDK